MIMSSNTAMLATAGPHFLSASATAPAPPREGRSIVLIGLMGAGKTAIGRRLAARLGLPFRDADTEIEQAAGCTIAEIFARYGEPAFRDGERLVIQRLLAAEPHVLATGGGAWMDARTRAAVREAGAVAVWLRGDIPLLARRVAGRTHRPLLRDGDPVAILTRLAEARHPVYAEADIVVDSTDDSADMMTERVMTAVQTFNRPHRMPVTLAASTYDLVIGEGLLARAGAWLAPELPGKRCVVVTDANLQTLHLPGVMAGLAEAGFSAAPIIMPPGEGSKSFACYQSVMEQVLGSGIDRNTAIIALGGGVVGDLAGFVAATALRGLPFVQMPTTLLAQVDSSVGGKTGINTSHGKNLAGAFHQPRIVLADTAALATLPARELRAGYAEIFKAGLIGDAAFYAWCEANGAKVVNGDRAAQAEAVRRACAFKAEVVGDDEREEKPDNGRALLNLGHTFAHALEAECHFDGTLLHGEAVALGIVLAFKLSAALGLCGAEDAARVTAHVRAVGMAAELPELGRVFSAAALTGHMRKDKKVRDGALRFVLARGIGEAFTASGVAEADVTTLLRREGCAA
jgi:shikimate kinase/3-dehydroquinate synthase